MKSKIYVLFALVLLVLLICISNTTAFYNTETISGVSLNKETIYSAENPSSNSFDSKIHKDIRKKIKENPEEKIVTLFKAVNESELDSIETLIESIGGKVLSKNKIGDIITAEIPAEKIREIIIDNSIESVWPDRIFHAVLEESVPQINAPFMWENGFNGNGIKIAVLDTGMDSNHLMLQGKIILEKDFTGSGSTNDIVGHGTHVAGIIAGTNEFGGLYNGVAPAALLINAKVLDDTGNGTESTIINGINWALDPDGNPETDDRADIINMSLGGAYADLNSPIVYAIKDAVEAGVIVVVAAGNCGLGCPSSNCNGFIGVETPGISPEAITVGTVDKQNNWACFSSGGIINENIKPDIVAPGVNINSSVPGGYSAHSGTSMATPHVAGAVSLLLQSNENLTPKEVKYILEASALKLGETGKDTKYGSGLIDAAKFIPSNVNNILKYEIEVPEIVYLYDEVIVSLVPLAGSIENAYAVIKDPNNIEYEINITEVNQNTWQGIFNNTGIIGVYSVDIFITDKVGNTTEFNENFGVIRFDSNNAFIEQIIALNEIPYDENFSITIVFKNNGNSSVDAIIEAQIIEENVLMDTIEKNITAEAQSENYIEFLFKPLEVLGAKKIFAVSSFEGNNHTKEKSFTAIDNTEPAINSVNFDNGIYKNQPAVIELIVEDASDVNGSLVLTNSLNETTVIPLKLIWEIGTQKKLTGTSYETELTGEYEFYFQLCDSKTNCINSLDYNFNVQECTGKNVLIVSENSNSNPEKFLSLFSDECAFVLETFNSSLPDNSQYFNKFELILWSTGKFFSENISEQAAELLLDYNKNIVFEGEDIAFNHGSDEFMINVANCIFEKELVLEDYNTAIELNKTLSHPLFNNLAGSIQFNSNISFFPDSLIAVNNGVELASWNVNGSAVIASNNGNRKTLFLPFSTEALGSNENTFIQNIINWMTTNQNQADLIPEITLIEPLIEGNNSINIKITNQGLTTANNVNVNLYSDGILEKTVFGDIPFSGFIELQEEIELNIGSHEIKITVNENLETIETNYLNNSYLVEEKVIPLEADLKAKSISLTISDEILISTEIENIGGTTAENVLVELFYNETKIYDQNTTINSRETKLIQTTAIKEKGIHSIEIKVNSEMTVPEYDYTNNNLEKELYVCSKANFLVVNDNDAENFTTDNPSSIKTFTDTLKTNGYCFQVWNENQNGVPDISFINEFNLIIWSAGDYWNTVIDENDMQLLEEFTGNIIFEGADIAFDHSGETFLEQKLHAVLDKDLIISEQETLILGTHRILNDINQITIDGNFSPYPDSLNPTDSISIAEWPNANTAIILHDSNNPIVYYGFSIDSIVEQDSKEKLILNSIDWIEESNTLCGDMVKDNSINVADIVFLVDALFRGGPDPYPLWTANVDGLEGINIADAVYLINYLWRAGPDLNCTPTKEFKSGNPEQETTLDEIQEIIKQNTINQTKPKKTV